MLDTLAAPLEIVTPPAAEPLSIAEAKGYLRIDTDSDDHRIEELIRVARERVEHDTHRALVTQTWRLHLDRAPRERVIWIPRAPLQSVASITYIDTAGASQTFDAAHYHVDTFSRPGRVYLAASSSWPSDLACRPGALRIEFTAGHGDSAAAIPESLRHALRYRLELEYDPVDPARAAVLERAYESLIWAQKVF